MLIRQLDDEDVDEGDGVDVFRDRVWFTLVNQARLHSTDGTLRRLSLERYFKGVPSAGAAPEQSKPETAPEGKTEPEARVAP